MSLNIETIMILRMKLIRRIRYRLQRLYIGKFLTYLQAATIREIAARVPLDQVVMFKMQGESYNLEPVRNVSKAKEKWYTCRVSG